MNPELQALYHDVILDHGRHPRNFQIPVGATHVLEGFNPLCGDKLTLYLQVNREGVIEDVGFQGNGCAISVASASLMTESIKRKTVSEAEVLFEVFHTMALDVEQKCTLPEQKWCVLAGVCAFPARVKCATLAWHTLMGVLHGEQNIISTEDNTV